MAQGVRSRDVLCPFYKGDDNRRIKCEGFLEGMVSIHLNFEEAFYLEYYMKKHCCAHYRDCEIYKLICRVRYPDDD